MKYLKTYEALSKKEKEEFANLKNEPYTTFSVNELIKDCNEYDIVLLDLLKEMMLNREVAFRCYWCYQNNVSVLFDNTHNIIGECIDIRNEDPAYLNSDFLIKIKGDKNKWHTLFSVDEKKKKVRIYNYIEGPIAQELDMLRNAKKYNL